MPRLLSPQPWTDRGSPHGPLGPLLCTATPSPGPCLTINFDLCFFSSTELPRSPGDAACALPKQSQTILALLTAGGLACDQFHGHGQKTIFINFL